MVGGVLDGERKIWVTPYGNRGNWIFLVATNGWLVVTFLLMASKNMWHAPFLGDQNNLVAI